MAKTVSLGPNQVTFYARAHDTKGAYALVEWKMAPPAAPGPPLHRHLEEDEACFLLDGELDLTLDGKMSRAAPGAYVLFPKGAWHSIANPGPSHARFLVILSPPGYEGYWEELGSLASPPDTGTVLTLQEKYHMDAGGQARRFE